MTDHDKQRERAADIRSDAAQDAAKHIDKAENAYAKSMLEPTEALQQTLFAELKGRIKEDDSSVPAPDGPFDYYSRFRE